MIVYLHPSQQPITPPWLADFQPVEGSDMSLCHRDTEHGHLVGIADPLVFDCPPLRCFHELDDGWKVAQAGPIEPLHLHRRLTWCRSVEARSMGGEVWRAPVILDDGGDRAFLVKFAGRDFLPSLTPEQERCEAVARAAREAIPAGLEMGAEACRWAAVLLSAGNLICAEAIAVLGLLDGQLVTETLNPAAGMRGRFVPPGSDA